MGPDRPQDGAAVDVEDLHETALVSSNAELAIAPDLTARRRLLEAGDGLDDAVRLWRVDLETGAGCDDVAVRGGRREVHVGDGRIRLEEGRRLMRRRTASVGLGTTSGRRCKE